MKVLTLIFVAIVAFMFINAGITDSIESTKENPYAKYKQMYARPIQQWEKPTLDDSVLNEWREFEPLPKLAPSPESNKFSESKAHLGKILFNDPKLSKSGQIACSSCHNEQLAFGDGLKTSIGHNRAFGRRNAPNIQMAGFFDVLFWDGRTPSLESQVLFPLQDSKEMANTLENVVRAVASNPRYYAMFIESFGNESQIKRWQKAHPLLFAKQSNFIPVPNIEPRLYPPTTKDSKNTESTFLQNAQIQKVLEIADNPLAKLTPNEKQHIREQARALFGTNDFAKKIDDKSDEIDLKARQSEYKKFSKNEINEAKKLINIENITKAIATYERTLVPQDTRFNRFLKGDYKELSDFEAYGLHIFRTKGRCMNCHYGVALSDSKFHNLGLSLYGRKGQDLGRGEITGKSEDMGAFRTPSLINVSKSAPYFHNAISPNLTGANHLYDMAFPVGRMPTDSMDISKLPPITPLIQRLNLTTIELQALEAFLESL